FLGIPYAAPPVGDLRWAPPKPVKSWTTDLAATEAGPNCMQARPPANVGGRAATMSEDCLTLNVWAPEKPNKAPVIVWIHGGGHVDGSASDKYTDGTAFAADGVIVVAMNYRLGALGFFAHPALGKDVNFGLLDEIAALNWVKANIAAFGGDPANVTIAGESSGGEDVLALMTSPPARGLFVRAIAESAGGGWWSPPTRAEAEVSGEKVAKKAGLKGKADAKALRALPADALAKAGAEEELGIVLDGQSLVDPRQQVFDAGKEAPVPLLIGTNSGEGSLLGENPDPKQIFPKVQPEDFAKLTQAYGGAEGAKLAKLMFRDGYFAGPTLDIARAHEKAGQPVYLYRFDFRMSVLRSRRPDAYHGSELPFVFGTLPPQAAGVDDALIQAAMHGCWATFARTGKPTCQMAPDWKPGATTWMVFDDTIGDRPIGSTDAIDLLRTRIEAAN
ncbi:MAG TPA: carboxylesterase family protein, partial [Hyphomonadaceae bacterium]|nr:carboxylesterase family protein [Hyphomonadaceae bacterium]